MSALLSPLIITGCHRSGTTWAGNCVGFSPRTFVLNEPFSPRRKEFPVRVPFVTDWYPKRGDDVDYEEIIFGLGGDYALGVLHSKLARCIGVRDRASQLKYFLWRKLQTARRLRPIVKDPNCLFLLPEILVNQSDSTVIVLVRHPAAFYSSIKRIDWDLDSNWTKKHTEIIKTFCGTDVIKILETECNSLLERACRHWMVINYFAIQLSRSFKQVRIVLHENLSANPVNEFRQIYMNAELNWNEEVASNILKLSGIENPVSPDVGSIHTLHRDSVSNRLRWKTLVEQKELSRIEQLTSPLSREFYPEDEYWHV